MGRIMKEADRVNYRLQLDPIQLANALQNGFVCYVLASLEVCS